MIRPMTPQPALHVFTAALLLGTAACGRAEVGPTEPSATGGTTATATAPAFAEHAAVTGQTRPHTAGGWVSLSNGVQMAVTAHLSGAAGGGQTTHGYRLQFHNPGVTAQFVDVNRLAVLTDDAGGSVQDAFPRDNGLKAVAAAAAEPPAALRPIPALLPGHSLQGWAFFTLAADVAVPRLTLLANDPTLGVKPDQSTAVFDVPAGTQGALLDVPAAEPTLAAGATLTGGATAITFAGTATAEPEPAYGTIKLTLPLTLTNELDRPAGESFGNTRMNNVVLIDGSGRAYSPDQQSFRSLGLTKLEPGASVETSVRFSVPEDVGGGFVLIADSKVGFKTSRKERDAFNAAPKGAWAVNLSP